MRRLAHLLIAAVSSCWLLVQAAPAAADEATRTIEGTLTSRVRMALSKDAFAVVEARGKDGRLLAETKVPADGHQLPLSYSLRIPAGVDATLRAGVFVRGRPSWASEPVQVTADSRHDAAVELALKPFKPMAFTSRLGCGDTIVTVGVVGQNAVLEAAGERFELAPVRSASGQRFEAAGDSGTFFWPKADKSLVSIRGQLLPECTDLAALQKQSIRARGNEPGWNLQIANGRIVLVTGTGAGAERNEAPLPAPQTETGAVLYRVKELNATVRMTGALCRDSATGMPHPKTVTVETAQRTLKGCGGEPVELLAGRPWNVTEIVGSQVADRPRVTIGFGPAGSAAGSAGCNPYRASVALSGEGLSFGKTLATGRRACPGPLMAQEHGFLDALQSVAGFDIGADGSLLLKASDGTTAIRAQRQ